MKKSKEFPIILNNPILLFFLFIFFSFEGISQVSEGVKPTLITKATSMRYVPSMASRDYLIPFENVNKEAKDGRSKRNIPISGKGSTGDDILAKNPNPFSQSRHGRAPSLVFDAFASGSQPTDPSGAVGPNHYFAVFNTGYIIYDKSGNNLTGQLSVTNIFSAGGCCDLTVSYDKAADRWVVSYLFAGSGVEVAVSDGPNPITSGWYVYTMSAINDYQKLSVWSDGYYMTDNTTATNKIYALERAQMLLGNPSAQIIGFPLPGITTSGFYSPQAFNVSNDDMPATGNLPIIYLQDDAWAGVSTDHIKLWEVDVDWVTPGNSTISGTPQQINTTAFTSVFDGGGFSNLAQPGGGTLIDALQATIMNQAQFRRFGTHNSVVFNFVVDTDGSSGKLAGVRWIEFRQNGDGQPWSLYQEGTYTSPDGKHAWNASIMMDNQGNIGMGYTGMSGPTTPTTVRASSFYTGRLSSDPLGTMTIVEESISFGNSNFTGSRYGDYSKIDIDPNDDQTFWFIDEYMNSGRKGVVGVFKIAQILTPIISFSSTSGNSTEATDCSFTDINVSLNIGLAPSANADVTFTINVSSTATSGLDFDLQTPSVTFPMGSTSSQTMILRVYHDGFVEGDETVIIDFTVNANGGDATADTNSDTYTFTITNDDAGPVASFTTDLINEDFEIDPSWSLIDQDGDGQNWSIGTVPATHLSTGQLFSRSWNTSPLTPDNYLITTQIVIPSTLTSLDLTYQVSPATLTNPWFEEYYTVYWATDISTVAAINGSPQVKPGGIIAQAVVNENLNMIAYIGQTGYLVFRHHNCTDEEYIAIDNMLLQGVSATNIQSTINSGAPDMVDLPGSGTLYTSDPTSGYVMADITNNNTFNYDCLNVSVSRAGTGAQSYNGSVFPDLVMNKTFDIIPTNSPSPGNVSVLFYFTEAEIAGWEAATGLSRTALIAMRENSGGSIAETSNLTIGAFGSHVTLTGTFTGLSDTFYFGTTNSFVSCPGATKTWNGLSWSPLGTPTISNAVIIDGNYNSATNGNINACTLTVNGFRTLTVGAGSYINVDGNITVNGSLIVEHQGSVVQIDKDVVTTNNNVINVELTTPVLQTRDFMVMGSPMTAETRTGVFTNAFLVLNSTPANFIPHPGVPAGGTNFADDNGNFWAQYAAGPINVGEGYIVRPQSGYTDPANTTYSMTYTLGTLNNGDLSRPVVFNGLGTNPDGTPNVYANPYASPMSGTDFINDNTLVNEIYFWEHLTPPSSAIPGSGSINFSMDDISMFNLSMPLPAANDPGTSTTPNGIISTGQGFGIKAFGAGTVTFSNTMRRTSGNTTLRNPEEEQQIDRLTLKVFSIDYEIGSYTGVAFNPMASQELDSGYDSNRIATVISLYSHLLDGTQQLGIQTREVFEESIKIPMGFATQVDQDATYRISITSIEGQQLSNATVYLIDNQLNIITNLTQGDYEFKSVMGTFNERFTLLFEQEDILGNSDIALERITLYPNPTQNVLNIISPQIVITNIEIYDLRGRRVAAGVDFNTQNMYQVDMSKLEPAMYFVKIFTEEGSITKKILKK